MIGYPINRLLNLYMFITEMIILTRFFKKNACKHGSYRTWKTWKIDRNLPKSEKLENSRNLNKKDFLGIFLQDQEKRRVRELKTLHREKKHEILYKLCIIHVRTMHE